MGRPLKVTTGPLCPRRLRKLCWNWRGSCWSCLRVGRKGEGRAWGRNVHNIAADTNILLILLLSNTIMVENVSVFHQLTMGVSDPLTQ